MTQNWTVKVRPSINSEDDRVMPTIGSNRSKLACTDMVIEEETCCTWSGELE